MSDILEVQELKKYFRVDGGSQLHAVDGVSFKIEKGQTLGVVGESGCGKSTLGRVILHLIEPSGGQIFFEGKDISNPNRSMINYVRENMQIIFQDPFSSLNPRMSVSETIMEPMIIKGGISRSDMYEKTLKLMDTVGLAQRFTNSYPHELDGGRRQRIGIARSLALDPKFIVCDEPVSALDVSIQAQILNLLLDLQEERNLSYIFITHDLSVVKYISNNILVMYLGQMVELAPSDELFENPAHPYTEALLSAIPVADIHVKHERLQMKGELTSPIDPKPGCRFMARCPYAAEKCAEPQTLQNISPDHQVSCWMKQS
ncbi:MAG: ATP-binding cassette domain-containing protein [Peptococcaceae bacterium]|jgi:peptide/nickel transport system ATP-binding protein|nr:ATP-binding cassette domain-containing protein [Peptococcaceae bacterium]